MAAAAAEDARGAAARLEAIWRRGGVAQWLLRPLALLHATLVGLRRGLYRAGLLRRKHLPVPMIVVGNRVAGGAGKTPVTIALVEALRAAGRRPGIVSRGHGRSDLAALHEVQPQDPAATCGDEPLLMRRRTGAPVGAGRDRAAAARQLLARPPDTDVIVCDDGLQHLRLARDIEIVVFDERGAGNGWLLPAGPLREPVDAPPAGRVQLAVHNTGSAEPAPGLPPGERLQRRLARRSRWPTGGPACQTAPARRPGPRCADAGFWPAPAPASPHASSTRCAPRAWTSTRWRSTTTTAMRRCPGRPPPPRCWSPRRMRSSWTRRAWPPNARGCASMWFHWCFNCLPD